MVVVVGVLVVAYAAWMPQVVVVMVVMEVPVMVVAVRVVVAVLVVVVVLVVVLMVVVAPVCLALCRFCVNPHFAISQYCQILSSDSFGPGFVSGPRHVSKASRRFLTKHH